MKKCTKCGIEKPLSQFHNMKVAPDGLAYNCKACAYLYVKTWKRNNPQRNKILQKRTVLKRKYKISLEEFNGMLDSQQNKCMICNKTFKNAKSTHVDHCHKSGKIRGLLCTNCNIALGYFKDSLSTIRSALKYLKKYSSKSVEK